MSILLLHQPVPEAIQVDHMPPPSNELAAEVSPQIAYSGVPSQEVLA